MKSAQCWAVGSKVLSSVVSKKISAGFARFFKIPNSQKKYKKNSQKQPQNKNIKESKTKKP
jgi:hypothetical protein